MSEKSLKPVSKLVAGLALAALVLTVALPALAHDPPKSLYQRLGGYDAIAAVTDDFLGRLIADPEFNRFFQGASADSQKKIRQLVVDQLCQVTGGPCVYIGRPMKQAHQGLGITKAMWDKTVGLLVATLDHFKVPDQEKHELLALVSTLESEIVDKP